MSLSVSSQFQWSVDQTAGGAASIMKGLIQAASSDNVQPLALHACEQLGMTLPILNTTTRIKIEQLAGRKHNQPLSFVKAQVGFRAGDSADMLAKTDGGLSFLCLAAILVSWGQGIQAAELLQSLVRQHAKSEQPLPTLLQLNDVLRALKPKLADSGFTREVAGCYDWCSSFLNQSLFAKFDGSLKIDVISTPDAPGVQHLLDALNRCFRLGDDSCTVRVESWKGFLPWVIAVAKWMLGEFPNVWLLDGSHLIKSSLPKISVFEVEIKSGGIKSSIWRYRRGPEHYFKVSLSRRLDSLDQLISTNETRHAGTVSGMLDAQLWMKFRIAKLALPKNLCAPMFYFVAKYLAPKVLFRQTLESAMQKARGIDTEVLLASAFPSQDTRLAAMQHLLGENIILPDKDPDFVNLNVDLTKACVCEKCHTDDRLPSQSYSISTCLEGKLGGLAADLLSLTLFATEDQIHQFPLLSYSPWLGRKTVLGGIDVISGSVGRAQSWQELITYGWRPIMVQKLQFLSCNSHAVFEHALDLMGQTFESETVLSSANGQVIYPSILERGPLQGSTYLQLTCTPGCLIWDGSSIGALVSNEPKGFDTYPRPRPHATGPTPHATGVEYSPTRRHMQPKSFSLTLSEAHQNDSLYSFIALVSIPTGEPTTLMFGKKFDVSGKEYYANVWDLIDGLSQAIFSSSCDHRQDSPAGVLGEHFLFLEHEFPSYSHELGDQSLLINHDGDPLIQMLQLAVSRECCILYRDGCISCALALAERLDVKMVIC